ncbi:hypothetical protein RRF57_008580 [Xylaria bambusicola]|uniref:Uncharacterized protein n=1 Tax=Xylaria bambusicola TaxID=326684 RepID=A0AAN7UU53_9PEZI
MPTRFILANRNTCRGHSLTKFPPRNSDVGIAAALDRADTSITLLEAACAFDEDPNYTDASRIFLEVFANQHVLQIQSQTLRSNILGQGSINSRIDERREERNIR